MHGQREQLLSFFHTLKGAGISLFLTTRPHPIDIQESFYNETIMDLSHDSSDIRKYVGSRISENKSFERLLKHGPSDLYERVVSRLVDSANGM